jgi:prepilin-type processing-associated H-X9-DG protein
MQAEEADLTGAGQRRRNATNRGIFRPGRPTKFRDVLDGLSNTILYSEVVASRRRNPGVSEIARDVPGINKNPSLCIDASKSADTKFWVFGRGSLWADGFLPISGFQTVLPPNSPSCTSDLGIEDTISSASSSHAGGVHVLMADGAVAFASNTIDTGDITAPGVSMDPGYAQPGSKSPYGIWGALGSRASAETIDSTPSISPIPRERRLLGSGSGRPSMSRWSDKSGNASLQAEMVKIIDQKTIQLKSAKGTIHEVPLNSLKDQDIYRAVMQDVLRKQSQ